MNTNIWDDKKLVGVLKQDGVVVMPTDTLYGIVGKAESREVVERIYKARKRNPEKPCIVLIGDISELGKFSIDLTDEQKKEINKYWEQESSPVSIILECADEKFEYLHRGTKTLAFRLPKDERLQSLLKETGPLVAPSANLEGLPPAKNVTGAREYFKDSVDLYLDGGIIQGKASKVIRLDTNGLAVVLRE